MDCMGPGDKMVGAILGSLEADSSCDQSNPENVRHVDTSLSIAGVRPSMELEVESCSEPPAQRLDSKRKDPLNNGLVGGGVLPQRLPLDMGAVSFVGAVKMLRGVALAVVVREAKEAVGELGSKPELHVSPGATGVPSQPSVLPKAGAVLGAPQLSRQLVFCCCR